MEFEFAQKQLSQSQQGGEGPPPPIPPAGGGETNTTKAETTTTVVGVDHRVSFRALCHLLEDVCRSRGTKQRVELIESLWQTIRGNDFYPFMRLLLPHLDTQRSTYGLKISKLAKIYIEILGLSPSSTDATRLMRWKDPTKSTVDVTHFSDVVFTILVNRAHGTASQNALTVADINQRLDELAGATSGERRKTILLNLLRCTSAVEQKWLIRVLLKDMRMHVQHTTLLGAFHPNALDTFNATNSLQAVCQKCANVNSLVSAEAAVAVKTHAAEVSLMQPFRPMLAGHVDPSKLQVLLKESRLSVEGKYDGERIMIHKNGMEVQYWTRNGKNYTDVYGPKFNPVVLKSVKASSAILDGEMLVWDAAKGQFKEFGSNRTHALAAERTEVGATAIYGTIDSGPQTTSTSTAAQKEWFCYCAFDLLLVEGENIARMTLDHRRERLKIVISQHTHQMEIVQSSPVSTVQDVLRALDGAMERRLEGIIIKANESVYVPGERKLKWLKLKPDHITGLADSLDLVVLGAYFGTKYGQRHLSHFLLGVIVDKASEGSNVSKTNSGDGVPQIGPDTKYHTLTKVGTGYSDAELRDLLTRIGDKWRTWDRTRPLPHLDGWKPAADDVPDVWIDPRQSVVLEVIGYSFTETVKFRTGFTLRFPRCTRIRYDKNIEDAMTLSQARNLYTMSINTKKTVNYEAEFLNSHRKGKKAAKTALISKEGFALPKRSYASLSVQEVIPTNTPKVSDIFDGHDVCILQNEVTRPRDDIERLIVAHGGRVVANPCKTMSILLASSAKSAKVSNWIDAAHKGLLSGYATTDVVSLSWLDDTIAAGELLPLAPRYMLYTSPRMTELFAISIDKYMDSYFDAATVDSVRASLEIAKQEMSLQDGVPSDRPRPKKRPSEVNATSALEDLEGLTLEIHHLKSGMGYSSSVPIADHGTEMFTNTIMYFASSLLHDPSGELNGVMCTALLRGATIIRDPHAHAVTHIVINPFVPEAVEAWARTKAHAASSLVYVVGPRWITDCVAQGRRLDATPYVVTKVSDTISDDAIRKLSSVQLSSDLFADFRARQSALVGDTQQQQQQRRIESELFPGISELGNPFSDVNN
eukprot:PhM_4_TR7572/c1_g1_i1/m.7768/K10777/LIG4, DNL4; DNA ligase 4